MNKFAILRHNKIKAGRHLVATGLHNGRGAFTANADPNAVPIRILVGSAAPHRDVWEDLKITGVGKVRKNGVVAVETLVTASPDWWASKGWKAGEKPSGELAQLLDDWIDANVDYLKERYGDRLVSVIAHLDEKSPHLQALAVPRELKVDKREAHGMKKWRLNVAIDLGSPGQLKQHQTEYAKRMERFGLVRGADIGTNERKKSGKGHKPLSEHQKDQEAETAKQVKITAEQDAALQAIRDISSKQEGITAQIELDGTKAAQDRETARQEAQKARQEREEAEALGNTNKELERSLAIQKRDQIKEGNRIAARNLRSKNKQQALEEVAAELSRLLDPIRIMVAQFAEAVGIKKQAIGKPGTVATDIAQSSEIRDLQAVIDRLKGIDR